METQQLPSEEPEQSKAPDPKSLISVPPQWPDPPAKEAFHGLAGDIVNMIAPHTEADPIAILVQILVAFGNVIGRHAHYRVEADDHYLNLFATLVGATGKGRKGTSLGHVNRVFQKVDESWVKHNVSTGGLSETVVGEIRRPPMRERSYVADGFWRHELGRPKRRRDPWQPKPPGVPPSPSARRRPGYSFPSCVPAELGSASPGIMECVPNLVFLGMR